tara:strand:+ start:30751 stop:31722 length:972 start_codon:yes stop_codon:yes gene_type:complete
MTASQNPSDRQSRLSMSLSHVLGEKKKPEKSDPFSEADVKPKTNDPASTVTAPPDSDKAIDDIDPLLVVPDSDPKRKMKSPAPLRFDRDEKVKRVGGKRATLAVLLSLLAVSGSAYIGYNQFLQSNNITQENEDAFKLIGSLSEDLNSNTLDLATLKSKSSIFEDALKGFTLIENELADQRAKIASLDSTARTQNKELEEALATIQQSQDHLDALKSSFQGLSQAQKDVVKIAEKKIAQARAASSPVRTEPPRPFIASTLGSAAVESMDSWGNNQYVVMRESNGSWTSVRRGSTYDGWIFTGATNEFAIFTRGDRTMKVKIGG